MKFFGFLKSLVLTLPLINSTHVVICDKIDNARCLIRKTLVNVNKNEPRYYPFLIELDKCGGSCNTIIIQLVENAGQVKVLREL